jgi:hypothetical protein
VSTAPAHAPLERERCVHGACGAEVVVRGQDQIRSLTIAGGRLIWGSYRVDARPSNTVRMLAKPGAAPHELARDLYGVCALAADDEHAYFIEAGYYGDDHVWRVSLAAGGKRQLLRSYRRGCALALTRRAAIYAETTLMAVPKAGGTPRPLAKAPVSDVVRAFGETLYWTAEDGVYRAQPDPPERVLAASNVYGLAITREHLVIQKSGNQPGILRARHDGSDAQLLYGGDAHGLVADDTHAFVATSERGERMIRRIRLRDGEMALLARRRGGLPELALGATHVYFTDPDAGLVLRVRK